MIYKVHNVKVVGSNDSQVTLEKTKGSVNYRMNVPKREFELGIQKGIYQVAEEEEVEKEPERMLV